MTHIEIAIRDAVEKGGYQVENLMFNGSVIFANEFSSAGTRHPADVWQDPAFWQALGRARGWEEENKSIHPNWKYYMHRFIDHLAEGKDAESFFKAIKEVEKHELTHRTTT